MAVVSIQNLKVEFGGRLLFENVSFDVNEGDFVGLIGANGTGKTTLFKILTGEMDYETWEPIMVPARLYDLGNTGEYAFIASIHSAVVTGGVDAEEETLEPTAVKQLAAGVFGK